MKAILSKVLATAILTIGSVTLVQAVPVTINMTADNIVADGGLCLDSSCIGGTSWEDLGVDTSNFSNWTQSTALTLDLAPGIYSFFWHVENSGNSSSGNPAALLAEILWDNNANYSSSLWEIYDYDTGNFIAYADEYGLNGGNNIWNNVNGGAVGGITGNANWIYTANNFANVDEDAWIRTSITINAVPEPASLALLGIGLMGISAFRRRKMPPVTS